ncbi:hypothetical protein HELRODRAFT_162758 [Helobdella robusta]|uniref:Uncharacterized protein n=1 Tax=Helobdella robusta TaxID=6412 RepID=T1ET35_HELRO|nr:hypothetical protein HELRODRAFT_162758 [Helobdella robusta]ESN99242.1 hypothetical protein HELRODRAFT_162758 [Helobdella robusta]
MCQNVLPSKRHIKDTDDNFLSNSMVSCEKIKMTDSSREPIPIQKISTSLNASTPEATSKPQPLDCNSDDDCDDYNEQKILNNVNDVSYNMLSSSLSNLKISCEDSGSLQNEREVESLTYVNTLLNRQRVAKITFRDEKAIKDDSTSINHLEVPSKPPSKLKWKGNLVHVLDDADDSNSPNKKCKEEFNSGTRSLHSPAPLRNFKSIINLVDGLITIRISTND